MPGFIRSVPAVESRRRLLSKRTRLTLDSVSALFPMFCKFWRANRACDRHAVGVPRALSKSWVAVSECPRASTQPTAIVTSARNRAAAGACHALQYRTPQLQRPRPPASPSSLPEWPSWAGLAASVAFTPAACAGRLIGRSARRAAPMLLATRRWASQERGLRTFLQTFPSLHRLRVRSVGPLPEFG